jgi:hypothetical protein
MHVWKQGILGTLLICRFAVQLACDYFFAMLGRQSLGKTMFGIAVVDSKTKSTKLGRRQMLVCLLHVINVLSERIFY